MGLAHTVLDDDPTWGALLDNLHVGYGLKRQGVGTRLLSLTAQAVLADRPDPACTCGSSSRTRTPAPSTTPAAARCVESREVLPPGGDPARLNGTPRGLRYTWPDPARLLGGPRLVRADRPGQNRLSLAGL